MHILNTVNTNSRVIKVPALIVPTKYLFFDDVNAFDVTNVLSESGSFQQCRIFFCRTKRQRLLKKLELN